MSFNKKNIIVDIERMKYPNTGLHNYCKNLCEFLLKQKNEEFNFYFFSHKNVPLPNTVQRINRKIIDKICLKPSSKYALWHGTYQSTKFVPLKPTKFVLTIHDLNFLYENISEGKKNKHLKNIQKKINRADYVTTISKFALGDVQKHLNLKGKKVKVIHNGVNLLCFPEFNTPSYFPKKKYFFTLGTVLFKKNFHELLKIMKINKEHELLIGGIQPDLNYLKELQKEAKNLDVTNQIKFLGAISEQEKYWYLNNCHAFLFPSLSEGFGIPVVEAMLLGKPVFLSTKTSLPEIGGSHAYYFENFDEEHMNTVIKNGLKDYTVNDKKEAIIKWAEQFSWEKTAKEYLEIYKEVLE